MKYIATDSGWLGKEKGFISAGTVFEWDGPKGLWMQEVGQKPVIAAEPDEPDRAAIVQGLNTLNIAFFKGAPTESLQATLNEALKAQGKAP